MDAGKNPSVMTDFWIDDCRARALVQDGGVTMDDCLRLFDRLQERVGAHAGQKDKKLGVLSDPDRFSGVYDFKPDAGGGNVKIMTSEEMTTLVQEKDQSRLRILLGGDELDRKKAELL